MKKNMGSLDKNIRLGLGIIILALSLYFGSWFGIVGVLLILTSVISFCPAYFPFKFSTIEKKNK